MNVKTQKFFTSGGKEIAILSDYDTEIEKILAKNRNIKNEDLEKFFSPTLDDLHDPFLMPDILPAVTRVLQAVKNNERVVVFGDYDVDGVSSTALLVRFLANELHAQVSYRLPHRVHDGYGLKDYFFDELAEKGVTLVITVDCGTRDIIPIWHAKKLGIDVVVTDHHAVPDVIPTEVIGIINPKRHDSQYPFSSLAWAGVALKFIHAMILTLAKTDAFFVENKKNLLTKYIDFASLGTVSDCMPLIDENRTITTLGLKQIKTSESAWLKKFLEWHDNIEWNAEIIGFQIGPRINASGRMDTPMTALRWLLASEEKCDIFFEEIEELNNQRREIVQNFTLEALENVDTKKPILFFVNKQLEHGLIGLVAGKLTENYNRVSIVLCEHHEKDGSVSLVASCRAPEWCHLMDLLDDSKELFLRYGWHKQAAGFSIIPDNLKKLEEKMIEKFYQIYPEIPHPTLKVETILPANAINMPLLETIEKFRPFGIGNPKPLFLLENVEITEVQRIGKEKNHAKIFIKQNPNLPILMWNIENEAKYLQIGNIVSLVIFLDKNTFNNKTSVQAFIQAICP